MIGLSHPGIAIMSLLEIAEGFNGCLLKLLYTQSRGLHPALLASQNAAALS